MIEKEKFLAYERVRRSGVTNMFDIKAVQKYSGLDKEDVLYVMNNYTELNERYGKNYE